MRDHCVFVENYEVYYHIDTYPSRGNGWDDAGEGAEWTITSILENGNEVMQVASIYELCDNYLMEHPECFEDDYDPLDE